jgi:2-dehydro-3-deoxygluconokinase
VKEPRVAKPPAIHLGPEVITLGECLVSFVAGELGPLTAAATFHPHPAGAEANVAVGLARLGRRVAFIGRVGDDGLGRRIVRALRGEGVDISGLAVDPAGPTGLMVRDRRMLGPAEVHYARTASAGSRLGPGDIREAESRGVFGAARWLHLTGITPALSGSCREAVELAIMVGRAAGLTVSLDVNLRRRLWTETEAAAVLGDLASRVDIVIADEDEAAVVSGTPRSAGHEALAAALVALGPGLAVLKLGDRGGFAVERGATDGVSVGSLPVATIVDPVGAGDAFCAGFIAARLDGLDLATALTWANACGASAVAAEGDQAGLPTSAELVRLGTRGGPDTLR